LSLISVLSLYANEEGGTCAPQVIAWGDFSKNQPICALLL